jgi:hypothetical protein
MRRIVGFRVKIGMGQIFLIIRGMIGGNIEDFVS